MEHTQLQGGLMVEILPTKVAVGVLPELEKMFHIQIETVLLYNIY